MATRANPTSTITKQQRSKALPANAVITMAKSNDVIQDTRDAEIHPPLPPKPYEKPPLPPPEPIAHKSVQDKRLDRLEEFLMQQSQDTKAMQEMIMGNMGLEYADNYNQGQYGPDNYEHYDPESLTESANIQGVNEQGVNETPANPQDADTSKEADVSSAKETGKGEGKFAAHFCGSNETAKPLDAELAARLTTYDDQENGGKGAK